MKYFKDNYDLQIDRLNRRLAELQEGEEKKSQNATAKLVQRKMNSKTAKRPPF